MLEWWRRLAWVSIVLSWLGVNSAIGAATTSTVEPLRSPLQVRLSWGHASPIATRFYLALAARHAAVGRVRAEGFEAGDRHQERVCETQAGAGDVDTILVEVSWPDTQASGRKPHSIWQYLLDHGEPGQVARLKDDSGLMPDAPVLTVFTEVGGTRGFSVALEPLVRHKAMWLPDHDVFVTLAETPVDLAVHRASLNGERVLDRVKRQPEATLAEWRSRWVDFGDPTRTHHGQETEWLGTRGHLTGLVARHGSLFKFGVDRWASVRPDFASPHKFRLDVLWPGGQWKSQRISDGLPILVTALERQGQRCDIEQFAAPLGLPASRDPRSTVGQGEQPAVLITRVQLAGTGPVGFGFRLATENTNRHPELREITGGWSVADRETGAVWLTIEPEPGWTVAARVTATDALNPRIELECVGPLDAGTPRTLTLKLPSPAVTAEAIGALTAMDFPQARAEVVRYWEEWLARGARFEVPEKTVNDLFRANLWHALLLPRHRTDERGVARIDLPYSNFAYGQFNSDWPINQAVYVDYMIHGLRGYFGVAEEEYAAMFHSQQKPDGRVGGYAEWGVYSPGMLYAIAQHFLLSRDRASFDRLLPASEKALDWCLREVERGQNHRDAPGLIVAPLNDLTHDARAWGFPNAYFVAGLEMFGRALEAYGHPRARAVKASARKMRADVERAFARASVKSPVVQLADGTWNNYVPCDAMTPRRLLDAWYPTDVDCGPLHLTRLAAIDPRGWLSTAMLHDHEDNLFLNQWGAANEPVYNQQATAYLHRDEPEAAIRAFYSMTACAFSHGQLTPLEHRWAWGQYYMPPSTDGAWFELYRNMLLNELPGEETLFVGQAVPRAWLADGNRVVVHHAPTHFGPVNLRMDSAVRSARITAEIQFASSRRPKNLVVRFRHPTGQALRSVTVNGAPWQDFDPRQETVRIQDPAQPVYRMVAAYGNGP